MLAEPNSLCLQCMKQAGQKEASVKLMLVRVLLKSRSSCPCYASLPATGPDQAMMDLGG